MKTYLVAVCGLSPQVITETLYSLHQQGMRVDAIRILTTRRGKDVSANSSALKTMANLFVISRTTATITKVSISPRAMIVSASAQVF